MKDEELAAHECEIRKVKGCDAPREAIRPNGSQTASSLSAAILRKEAPIHQCDPPEGVEPGALNKYPLPRETLIAGPVIRRANRSDQLEDGVGWLIHVVSADMCVPVPVIAGQYYDDTPRLGIAAEMLVPPPDSSLGGVLEEDWND